MQLLYYSLALYLSLAAADPAPAKSTDTPREPCTIRSPTSGAFFDLNPLHILPPAESKSKHKRENSWNTTGCDYGYNFTLNFCGPVIEPLEKVEGVDKHLLGTVSAYYKDASGAVFSIGQENHEPVLRGRKLVLNYTGGSPCGSKSKSRRSVDLLNEREIIDDDDDDDDKKKKGKDDDDKDDPPKSKNPASGERRKSTIISMLCDRDPMSPQLTLNFVGADQDECVYFFEARSSAACGEIIILIVYLPLLALAGIEGKMFRPMAETVAFAILGAFILSLTYVPMMSALALSRSTENKPNFSDRMMAFVTRRYHPLLKAALRHQAAVLLTAAGLLVGGFLCFARLAASTFTRSAKATLRLKCARSPAAP